MSGKKNFKLSIAEDPCEKEADSSSELLPPYDEEQALLLPTKQKDGELCQQKSPNANKDRKPNNSGWFQRRFTGLGTDFTTSPHDRNSTLLDQFTNLHNRISTTVDRLNTTLHDRHSALLDRFSTTVDGLNTTLRNQNIALQAENAVLKDWNADLRSQLSARCGEPVANDGTTLKQQIESLRAEIRMLLSQREDAKSHRDDPRSPSDQGVSSLEPQESSELVGPEKSVSQVTDHSGSAGAATS